MPVFLALSTGLAHRNATPLESRNSDGFEILSLSVDDHLMTARPRPNLFAPTLQAYLARFTPCMVLTSRSAFVSLVEWYSFNFFSNIKSGRLLRSAKDFPVVVT
ncbi:hypothetical protein VTN77DRAFT_5743 [Rasamsonia byssochlamydoides]|uniref:uncharacterized protein n=1 Tax=Rasamsonia byssochlamydoides TaxID=89139 RepID=UPI003742CBEB